MRRSLLITALLLAGCTVGCTTMVPEDAGFPDVQHRLATRSPGVTVVWNRNSTDDATAAAAVTRLLAQPVTADSAVQIALLNNRRMQAVYEELMIAQADLVAAGLLRNPVFDAEVKVPVFGSGSLGVELQVVQEFIRVFQIPLRKKIAGVKFEAAKLKVTGQAIAFAADVRRAYIEAAAAQEMLALAQTDCGESEKRCVTPFKKGSHIFSGEQLVFEANRARLERSSAELGAAVAREKLAGMMGLWGKQTVALKMPGRLPAVPETDYVPASVERAAVANSLDLAIGRQNILETASQLGIDTSHLNLGVAADRYPDTGHWAVGPTVAIPIPIFDNGQAEKAALASQLRRAHANFYATAVEIRSAARVTTAQVATARAQVRFSEKTLVPSLPAVTTPEGHRQWVETKQKHIELVRNYFLAREAQTELLAGHLPLPLPLKGEVAVGWK